MSLLIETERGARKIYFPGQLISGHVDYKLIKQRRIRHATISFRGKITTLHAESRKGTSGATHGPRRRTEEVLRLFDYKIKLFEGPYDVPAQRFRWPFEFEIPTHVDVSRTENRNPGFIPDGRSGLPPSFEFDTATFSYSAGARVKYKVAVIVESAGLFSNDELELPIVIRRMAAPNVIPDLYLTQREILPSIYWTSRDLRPQAHTIKQKFRHVFTSDPELQTPGIAFRAFVTLPHSITPYQTWPLDFSIEHFKKGPNDPDAPNLILNSVRLALYSKTELTAARAGPIISGDRYAQGGTFEADRLIMLKQVELPLNNTSVRIAENVKLADWAESGFLGGFMTYTIRHTHKLRVEVLIMHRETRHSFNLKTDVPIRILDPTYIELGVDPPLGPPPDAAVTREIVDDPDLPRYEDDIMPPSMLAVATEDEAALFQRHMALSNA